jgi:hypothetical protein
MNQFIEECRREWKRLRVPDPVANDMAAELAADLNEAESEGASAGDVLGSGAFAPRSFAASWAAERGVIPPPPLTDRPHTRSPIHLAIALTVTAAIGAALVIFASPRDSTTALPGVFAAPGDMPHTVWVSYPHTVEASDVPRALEANGSGVNTVGSVLLIVGTVGITLAMLVLFRSSRAGPDHWSRRRRFIDEAPGGPG